MKTRDCQPVAKKHQVCSYCCDLSSHLVRLSALVPVLYTMLELLELFF